MPSAPSGKSRRWVRPSVYLVCCLLVAATHRVILAWISSNFGHRIMIVAIALLTLSISVGSVWAQASNANHFGDRNA